MFKKYTFVHSIGRNAVLQIVVVVHHKRFSFSYTCTWIWLAPSNIMPYNYSPCSEREIWPFVKVAISPKPERSHPPKLVCKYVTSTSTCMIFLNRF